MASAITVLVATALAVTAKAVVMAEAAGHAARRVLATALAVAAKKAVAEAVYTARYHRVLALKLGASQKLRGAGAGCHADSPRERTQKQAKTDHQSSGSALPVTGSKSRSIFHLLAFCAATHLSQA
jgi:hypothetical protein